MAKAKSILNESPKETYERRVRALVGQYNGNIDLLVRDTTREIFRRVRIPDREVGTVDAPTEKTVSSGRFYVLRYDAGVAMVFLPVLLLQLKFLDGRWIAHCLNLDYLPWKAKAGLFNQFDVAFRQVLETNEVASRVQEERGLTTTEPLYEMVYKYLKSRKLNFAISAYHVDRLERAHRLSTRLLEQLPFLYTKPINQAVIKATVLQLEDASEKAGLSKFLEEYEAVNEQNYTKVEEYFKRLAALEDGLRKLR